MRKLHKIFFRLFLLLLLTTGYGLLTANAAVPHLINYQGRLTDSSGNPLNGSYNLTFRIYDVETAGNLLWEEVQSGVLIQKGIFSALLGSVTALNLPFDIPYFLEIKVGSEVMSPRQRITSAGYAIKAETAEQAANATKVANVEVSTTPAANKILPLDNNAKIAQSVIALKVYDSGWFAVSGSTTYTKTHNLGTTKVIAQLWFSTSSDGSNAMMPGNNLFGASGDSYTNWINTLTTTAISVKTGNAVCVYYPPGINVSLYGSGYYRIIMLALE